VSGVGVHRSLTARVTGAVRAHWLMIAVTVIVTTLVPLRPSSARPPSYRAEELALVGLQGGPPRHGDLVGKLWDTGTLAPMVSSLPMATLAISLAGVPRSPYEVAGAATAKPVAGTILIRIDVEDRDPTVAARLAAVMPAALGTEVERLQQPGRTAAIPLRIAPVGSPAVVKMAGKDRVGEAAAAGLFGLLLALAVALVLDHLDPSARRPADLATVALPVLGAVAAYRPGDVLPAGEVVRAV
jgi:hypothetical protein